MAKNDFFLFILSYLTPLISININFLRVICFLLTSNFLKSCETISVRNYKKSRGKLVRARRIKPSILENCRGHRVHATGKQTLSNLHLGYNK